MKYKCPHCEAEITPSTSRQEFRPPEHVKKPEPTDTYEIVSASCPECGSGWTRDSRVANDLEDLNLLRQVHEARVNANEEARLKREAGAEEESEGTEETK